MISKLASNEQNLIQIQRKNAKTKEIFINPFQLAEHYGLNPINKAFWLSLQYCFGFR
jgi:hypothetical protein